MSAKFLIPLCAATALMTACNPREDPRKDSGTTGETATSPQTPPAEAQPTNPTPADPPPVDTPSTDSQPPDPTPGG